MIAKLPPNITDLKPRITVIGVGGAGCNAVNNMIDANLDGVDFVVANTDAQSLVASNAPHKIQLGARLTEGLGAGSRPEIGEAAAEETIDDIRELVRGSHMVFVAAGMGGGTGTGAAAVIARAAREQNILTVAVVTKPFQFEGTRRMRIAEAGIAELKKHVDTLIVIPNQNLFRIASERTTFAEAFVLADQVLYSGVACIVDLIVKEGLINLDFADVRTVMSGMGSAMMGTGEAAGEDRAVRAAEEAITNPLLDDVTLSGARGLLLSITGGADLTLYEVDEAASRVRREVDPEANIIVGATFDPSLGERVRVSIVASGMAQAQANAADAPRPSSMPPPMSAPPVPAPVHGQGQRAPIMDERPSQAFSELAAAPAEPARQPPPVPFPHAGPFAHNVPYAHEAAYAQPAAAPPANPPVAASPSWHGPDDIEITDMAPGAFAGTGYAPPADAFAAQPRAAPPPHETFAPAPPLDVRRAPRRMPELGDFPPVGQREYAAKTQRGDAVNPSASRLDPEPRRRGLFERLTGIGKRESDSRVERRETHVTAAPKAPPRDHSYSVGGDAHEPRPARHDDEQHRQEKPDFPVFFNKSRR
jgi:cell division protein FtsZ